MPRIDFILEPQRVASDTPAAERELLRAVSAAPPASSGILRVYDFRGDVLSLGRYHLAPEVPPTTTVALHRRYSGGRAVPFGDGFVGVSLVLPHRSALCAEDPLALAPYQVPNRYVRGVLEGCKLRGIPAFYPGRDFITVNSRILGLASFEVDPGGALLFEVIIANRRDFSILPELLDTVDPQGIIKSEMLTPEMTTCLARERTGELSLEAVADLVRRGYEKQFRLQCNEATKAVADRADGNRASDAASAAQWLQQRRLRPDLDHYGMERVQLGLLEVYFALQPDGRIATAMLAGDFIADSAAIERLERDLKGCAADPSAIDAVVSAVFANPEHFILGIGSPRTITAAIMKGLRS